MPGFGGLAGLAAALWRAGFSGQTLVWRPRYGTDALDSYGLSLGGDPHAPQGVARCPVCWNGTLQRPQSSVCTTCFGTGWTGGFGGGQGIDGLVATGTYTLKMQESGELMAISGVWLRCDPLAGPILPQDLIVDQGVPTTRYLVGEMAQVLGLGGTPYGRILQLEALAPDSPWQLVS